MPLTIAEFIQMLEEYPPDFEIRLDAINVGDSKDAYINELALDDNEAIVWIRN